MFKRIKKLNQPSIYVFVNPEIVNNKLVKQIGYGIEEEGIPFEIHYKEEVNSYNLAYKAAQNSKLGIGVGVNKEHVVLQMKKLKPKKPIFKLEIKTLQEAKIMGNNAARLEKKIPFKEF